MIAPNKTSHTSIRPFGGATVHTILSSVVPSAELGNTHTTECLNKGIWSVNKSCAYPATKKTQCMPGP